MIKRKYFYNVRWNHNDARGSYAYECGVVDYKSILPNHCRVFDEIKSRVRSMYAEKYPNGSVEVIAFNRI